MGALTWVAATGTCNEVGSIVFFGSGGVPPLGALSKVGITGADEPFTLGV